MIFLANSLVAIGLIEDMSITSVPCFSPSATPPAPNSTASTSGVSGTMMMTTSDFAATDFASATTSAAARISAVRLARSGTIRSWPPFFRLSAIGRPMMPRPMKPIFMVSLPVACRLF